MTQLITLKDSTTEELFAELTALHGPAATLRLARQMQSVAVKRRAVGFPDALDGVKKTLWADVRAQARIPHLDLVEKAVASDDGFAKYLFRGEGPDTFEAVRIPLMHRPGDEKYIVCVSSQVGCAAACAFCATGRLGFRRHLKTWEIVDQVLKIQADSPHPVRGIVFMGMGEPLFNYQRVMRAAGVLSDPSGAAIDSKAITISTVGIVPMMKRFLAEHKYFRLIVSVHAATEALRNELVPANQNYPLPDIIALLRQHQEATGKRVNLAWTMMAGVNMGRDQIVELARLTKGMRLLLDLIPVNDATGRFRPPTRVELDEFLDMVRAELGCPIVIRYSGGKEVHGACGMLAGKEISTSKSSNIYPSCVP